jgi:hypothetical protein
MKISEKILNEIFRYKEINNYISEQELPPPPGAEAGGAPPPPIPPPPGVGAPPSGPEAGAPPATGAPAPPAVPEPVDVEADPDVEKIDDEKENKKEIKVTDLVKSQKNVEEKQNEYFENLFNHLNDLESKLSAMDEIMDKLNTIETKIEKYRTKSPEEKLQLRTLDSGPFNQKLSQYFEDKEEEFEASGKDQYVITPDEVESYSPSDIKRSFRDFGDSEMTPDNDMSGFKKIY